MTATQRDDQLETTSEEREESADSRGYDLRGTTTMAGAHAAHDLYGGFLGPLLPAIQTKLGISLTLVSLMIPAQQLPGIFQPFIGYLADKTSRRWFVVLSPGIAGITVSSIGLAPHVGIVLMLLFVSGLTSGAFHAPAVALMGEYGGSKMGRAMSFFFAGAEIARAIAPLIITAAIALFTLEGAAVVMVFGIAASVILYFTVDTAASDAARKEAPDIDLKALFGSRRKWFSALVAISMLNAVATGPFHFFLVKLLIDKGRGDWYAGLSLTIFFAAGVVGMLGGGVIADRIGHRNTLGLAMLMTTPLLYLYLLIENGSIITIGLLIPAAAVLTSVRPIIMAISQEMAPEARGTMSGAMLALGFVTMSLTSFAFGAFADWIGIETAFLFIAGASILTLPFIALLPRHNVLV